MVKDGLVLDPIRHRYILEQLNVSNYPFRYRDLERLADFQNRLFAKYARANGIAFIDVAGQLAARSRSLPRRGATNHAGTRLRAWITFNQLFR